MQKEILLLRPVNTKRNNPTKILDSKLKRLKSFDSGFKFHFEILPYKNIHEAMQEIFAEKKCFLVLGGLTKHGMALFEEGSSGPRRKKKGNPTIQDKKGTEIVLDIDDHIIKGFDALKPEAAIKAWLKKKKINCDVTWQITSSQQLNTEEARIRLYFETAKLHTLIERKAWAQSPKIEADGSVFTCSQPIYTAPPIIQKGKDPIKVRTGFIKGTAKAFKLPKIKPDKIKEYTQYNGGIEYDFDSPDLPQDFLEGKVYRKYLMPMAFHYANKRIDREAIFAIIHSKAVQCKSRIFNPENTYDFIDDAIHKIGHEDLDRASDSETVGESDVKIEEMDSVPEMPKNIMDEWPEPWPMIWKNFKKVPRELSQELLVPTILSVNSFLMRSNYVNAMNRRPNMFFLNITPSTGNKDVNSKNVIEDLDAIFKRHGKKRSLTTPFSQMINSESSITADTSFLQSFDEDENLFWLNTESTRIFQQINNMGNSSVAGLADKLIEVVDGRGISGKRKAAGGGQSGSVKSVNDPCCQILFYAQPETIEKHISSDIVDSGLFGRPMLSIVPNLEFDEDNFSIFKHEGANKKKVSNTFYDFYNSSAMMYSKTDNKKVLEPTKKDLDKLHEWSRKILFPYMKDDDVLLKVLKRMGISAEYLYVIVLGVCRSWDLYKKRKPRKSIPVECLFPLLDYWTDTKIYAIENYISTTLDPLYDTILEVIKEFINGKHRNGMNVKDTKMLKDQNMIARSKLMNILTTRKKLISKLDAKGEKNNAANKAIQLISMMIRTGILKEEEEGHKLFLGILK